MAEHGVPRRVLRDQGRKSADFGLPGVHKMLVGFFTHRRRAEVRQKRVPSDPVVLGQVR